MSLPQLERLKKDYRDLENYEYRLVKKGMVDTIKKTRMKRDYLGKLIEQFEQEMYSPAI